MSFSTYYDINKRPKHLTATGEEEFDPSIERWDVFQKFESIQKSIADAKAGVDQAEASKAIARTPQRVIDTMFAARGELDIILDLVSLVEQQQFVSVAHVPHIPDPTADANAATYKFLQRRRQMQAATERLRAGATVLREQCAVRSKFLLDLAEIRKDWPLSRRSTAAGGGFIVDVSLPLNTQRASSTSAPPPSTGAPKSSELTIVPDAYGVACLVLHSTDGTRRLVKGPEAVGAELRRLQLMTAWQVLLNLLAAETQRSTECYDLDGAAEAVHRMARVALEKQQSSGQNSAQDAEKSLHHHPVQAAAVDIAEHRAATTILDGRGDAARDVAAFCGTEFCQVLFEARALRLLSELVEIERTPALVLHARGGGQMSRSHSPAVLETLTAWLRHAALKHAIECMLTKYVDDVVDDRCRVQPVPVEGELSAAWQIEGPTGGVQGVLAVERDGLRWEGTNPPGIGPSLGRKQLEMLVAAVMQGTV